MTRKYGKCLRVQSNITCFWRGFAHVIRAAGAKMTAANVLMERGTELSPEEAADILKNDSATSIIVPPTSPEGGHVYLFKPDKEANAGRWKITHTISVV